MITINIEKAKEIAHKERRIVREAEFAPYDEIISKKIPGTAEEQAEAARQSIREKYAMIQEQIDSSSDADELLSIVNSFKP